MTYSQTSPHQLPSRGIAEIAVHDARLLALQAENAALKTRLAMAIQHAPAGAPLVDALEEFQAHFIAKDAVIGLMRHELAQHSGSAQRRARLVADLWRVEAEFIALRQAFEKCLHEAANPEEVSNCLAQTTLL